MHVLITGGAGFIGSNLSAEFLRADERVTILDTLQRPGSHLNLTWLRELAKRDQLTLLCGDVRQGALVDAAVGSGVDLVFHLAAQTAVTTSVANPREDLDVNVMGTFNVLEAVRRLRPNSPPALFFTSTNKVYGALSGRDIVEASTRHRFADEHLHAHGIDETEPLDFHSPYGCSKGAADQYVRDYSRIYGLPTVVFRMSCIYGPRQFGTEDQGWVAHFFIAAERGEDLAIYGDGKQVRDLLYIDDLVRAFRMAADRIQTTAGRVYNIGGGPANSLSVWHELRPRIEALAGRPIGHCLHAWRPGDQPVYISNAAAAARDFAWRARVGLDEGLGGLWQWVQSAAKSAPVHV